MSKPIIVLEQEMRQDLADVANKYINTLPASMIAGFLSKLTEQFETLAVNQYKEALARYEDSLKEESEGEKDE